MKTNTHTEHVQNSEIFPPFDTAHYVSQIFWLSLTFSILYLIFSKILLPRLSSTIEERRDRIADDLDAVEHMKNQAENAKRAYEKSLAQAREKAHKHAQNVHDEIHKEIQKEMAETEAEMIKKQLKAETKIKKENEEMYKRLNAISAHIAFCISDKILKPKCFSENKIEETIQKLSPISVQKINPQDKKG